ncbi:molybdopterin molybdotransferase [Bathymodiolus japonicus methanotrophic gill symbiont]|uniref:molybdopterin molybdotransferase MoeA n=1 Tax=Bathymodiolus japonicus methanotrophic gill symbiont TaxID=113269 RepID=UPI001B7880D5|nr:gephyrin-like molybdotransferase Glp [Bathymodiolus japonicus methanotrophic gill symbiont]GFO71949.1 molybdopterin molybdotransferase [Bathymodiolus japonicus methanotrophic gill symbiont]
MNTTQPSCTDINEPGLLHIDQARKTILQTMPVLQESQQIPIEQAKGRCLAEAIISPLQVPGHTNSAVDGYALRYSDLAERNAQTQLKIKATVLAGQLYRENCLPGHCIRIMTGAAMPAGLDTVIMQEHCLVTGNVMQLDGTHKKGENVRQAGEDIQRDATVLAKGKMLYPADIGLLASLGITEIKVIRKLRIAIASTGNEINKIASVLPDGGLYDSNRYCLHAALARPDIELIDLGIIPDNESELLKHFNDAADYADIIISTGGVSIGEADFTKAALQNSGNIAFWKVAIKPGRPIAFGKIRQSVFFGLPGNPVAVLITLYQFVLPALEKMLGMTDKPIAPLIQARSLEAMRKKPGRTEVQRGIVGQTASGELQVKTTGKQGSGILTSISMANCFIILEHDRDGIEQGDWVDVQLFSGLI